MSISEQQVKNIAHLSRIHLRDEEVQSLTKNLESILAYIAKLQKLNVDTIKPTSHVLSLQNVFREDTVKPSLNQKEALTIAVASHKGSFKVPQVIE